MGPNPIHFSLAFSTNILLIYYCFTEAMASPRRCREGHLLPEHMSPASAGRLSNQFVFLSDDCENQKLC